MGGRKVAQSRVSQAMIDWLLSRTLAPVAASLLDFGDLDFTQPAGEPAVVAADSVTWRVFRNPVSLYIGGIAAVLLEFGDPRVRSGVWQYSSFRNDPGERMRRTGAAAMMTVYGARSRFEALARRVNDIHQGVKGVTRDGEPYRAMDPELLLWVQATATYAFLAAYEAYVRPVAAADRDLYYREAAPGAALYGVVDPPRSETELRQLFELAMPRLEASQEIEEFLHIMRTAPILPLPLRPLQRLIVRAARDLVPEGIRARIGLADEPGLTSSQRALVKAMARTADRLHLPDSPWSQASVRLGLPPDYLDRRG